MDRYASLEPAYLATLYRVDEPELVIRAGQTNPLLDQWLREQGAVSWAFISAWNPWSQATDDSDNAAQHRDLVKACEPYQIFEGRGEPAEGDDWPAETSLLVLDISRTAAEDLCVCFDQYAFVYGTLGSAAELVPHPYPPLASHPA